MVTLMLAHINLHDEMAERLRRFAQITVAPKARAVWERELPVRDELDVEEPPADERRDG